MQAVILAGGQGTRLKPYTASFPKPLVPIGDLPILEVIIHQLRRSGFREIVISTGHLAQLIEAYFGDGQRWGVRMRYVREQKPMNTAGALKLIQGLNDQFLVMNGDILTTLDFERLYRLHTEKQATATIATTVRKMKVDFGVLEVDGDHNLSTYTEKPIETFRVSMGIYVLSKNAINLIEPDEAIGMPDLLLRIKSSAQKVHCYPSEDYWLDIGRVDDYEEAQREFSEKKHLFMGPEA